MRSHYVITADDAQTRARVRDCGADCLWIDLESRHPAHARIADFLRWARPQRTPCLFVRVDEIDSSDFDLNLAIVMQAKPDGIVLPNARHGLDVQQLGAKLAVQEAENGFPDGSTKIIAIAAQTPASIFQLGTYIGASRRLVGLAWAPEGLAAAMGVAAIYTPDGTLTVPLATARALTVLAAKGAGVAAIDAACVTRDGPSLKSRCDAALGDGFSGKLAFDADQIATINAVFAVQHPR